MELEIVEARGTGSESGVDELVEPIDLLQQHGHLPAGFIAIGNPPARIGVVDILGGLQAARLDVLVRDAEAGKRFQQPVDALVHGFLGRQRLRGAGFEREAQARAVRLGGDLAFARHHDMRRIGKRRAGEGRTRQHEKQGEKNLTHEISFSSEVMGPFYFSLRQLIEPRLSIVLDSISMSKPLRSRYFRVTAEPEPTIDTP